jgi:alkylmercury lyase
MQHPSLDTIAAHFLERSARSQEDLSHTILEQVARGQPMEKTRLSAALHLSQEELEQRLAQFPDLEFDQQGNIVGWGVTLVPTRHRFQIHGQALFTWCAFDTVLYPPLLRAEAQVQSTCPVTGRPISFVATPDGSVKKLIQDACVLSLLISTRQQHRGRAGFCERSLFFWEEQAASSFLASHPEAILLSIEEAAYVGKLVAQNRAKGAER